jgi:hypothetical protein
VSDICAYLIYDLRDPLQSYNHQIATNLCHLSAKGMARLMLYKSHLSERASKAGDIRHALEKGDNVVGFLHHYKYGNVGAPE